MKILMLRQVVGSSECRDVRTTRAYVVRKKPLYHNCQLRSPDGQLLCTCDIKKAMWYIDKGLGGTCSTSQSSSNNKLL